MSAADVQSGINAVLAAVGSFAILYWIFQAGVRKGTQAARLQIMTAVRKELGGDAWRKVQERLNDA